MSAPSRTIERIALRANLTVPAVRYWAETRGSVLGIHRDASGEWHFSPQAVDFLQQLGNLQPPATAATSEPGVGASSPTRSKAPRTQPPRRQQPPEASPEAGLHRELHKIVEALRELERRHDDTVNRTADLTEDVKQMQILLSRMMELLTPPSPPGERRRIVRPWRPPRV